MCHCCCRAIAIPPIGAVEGLASASYRPCQPLAVGAGVKPAGGVALGAAVGRAGGQWGDASVPAKLGWVLVHAVQTFDEVIEVHAAAVHLVGIVDLSRTSIGPLIDGLSGRWRVAIGQSGGGRAKQTSKNSKNKAHGGPVQMGNALIWGCGTESGKGCVADRRIAAGFCRLPYFRALAAVRTAAGIWAPPLRLIRHLTD